MRVADRDPSRLWILLLIASIVVLFLGLPLPLTDGVTAFYGKIAKNILTNADWLTLRHQSMPVVDKPPLTFWLMSLSFMAFGTAEWALRIWHVALAVAVALATYALARLDLPGYRALAAATILLTTMQFFYQSLVPEQHVPLALFLTLSIYWELRWEREARLHAAILAWLAAALAVLSIGVAGAGMVALVVGAHLVVDRPPLPRHALLATVLGAAIFLLVAAPWFVIGVERQGRPFIDTFFLGGTLGVGRFFHHVQRSPTVVPWWAGFGAYLILLPLGFLPWTGWVWPALKGGWAARRSGPPVLWICTLWTLAIFGLLSASLGDKSSRYLLPVFPPLAVLAGHAVGDPRWARPAAVSSLATAAALLGLATAVAFLRFAGEAARYTPLIWSFLPAFIAGLCAYAIATFLDRPMTGVAVLTLCTLLSYALAITVVARVWDEVSPWRPLAKIVNGLGPPGARVLVRGTDNSFAEYYITRPVEYVSRAALRRDWGRGAVIAILPEGELSTLPAFPRPILAGRAPTGLVVVTNSPASPGR